MIITKNTHPSFRYMIALSIVGLATAWASTVAAAPIPALNLTHTSSTVNISIMGADSNATVMFEYAIDPTSATFTAIDIGHTDSNGSFNISVAPNSYGLNGGSLVYVSVDGTASSRAVWPAPASSSGTLSLSRQSQTLSVGDSTSIIGLNTANTLTLAGNSNPSVAMAVIQDNALFITALAPGVSTITACASSDGCGSVNITVQQSVQAVTFSQSQAYVVAGQSAQTIGVYGPGSYYGLTNSNKDSVSAALDGTNLILTGIAVGKSVVSLCATGLQCGSITVNALSSGSPIPTVVTTAAPDYTGKPPQLSSMTVSSNNVYGSFFGAGSTLNINFSANESVTNVQAKIGGVQAAVNQNDGGAYNISRLLTGTESLPLPIAITFVNSSGQSGQAYFSIGASTPTVVSAGAGTAAQGSYAFGKYLYEGMTAAGRTDPDVTVLQQRLKADKIYAGPVTGYFGPATKTAVQAYQKKNGLSQLGAVGPSTRASLNKGI